MASKLQIRSFKTKLSILVFAAILLPLVVSNILVGSILNSQLLQSHEDRLKADLETFGLILQHTEQEFNQGLLRIASDNTLQVTLDLEIFSQLNHYLERQIDVLGFSGLSVADKDKKIVASVNMEQYQILDTKTAQIILDENKAYFHQTAAIYRDDTLLGYVAGTLDFSAPEYLAYLQKHLFDKFIVWVNRDVVASNLFAGKNQTSPLPHQGFKHRITIEGESYRIRTANFMVGTKRLTYGVLMPMEELYRGRRIMLAVLIGVTVVLFGLISLLLRYFINELIFPITRLTQAASSIQRGDSKIPNLDYDRTDEFGTLNRTFHDMHASLNSYIVDIEAKNTRLQAINEEIEQCVQERTKALKNEIEERLKAEDALRKSERRLQNKLDYLISPEGEVEKFSFTDIINLEDLQSIQDAFANATGVASVVVDVEGKPITQPSNFCEACQIIRATEKGAQRCKLSNKALGLETRRKMQPTCHQCLSCGFLSAGAPIVVAGQHLANWLIGQTDTLDVDEQHVRDYAEKIDADPDRLGEAFRHIDTLPEARFHQALSLLWLLAREISTLGYNNLNLTKDLAEIKRAEEERLRLATAIQQAAEMVIVTDAEGIIEYVNPAFEALTGYTHAEALHHPLNAVQPHTENTLTHYAIFEAAAEAGTWRGHTAHHRKDGAVYHIEATYSAVRNTAGKIVNYVSVQHDTSREEKLEQQLRQAQKMEAIGTLAGGIAHDFNNILQAILGYADLVHEKTAPTPQLQSWVGEILCAGHRAAELVNQILTFSRQAEQEHRPIMLQSLTKEALKLLRGSLPSTIQIITKIDNDCPLIQADPTQAHQVIMNLCTNAYQAMHGQGGELRVEVQPHTLSPVQEEKDQGIPPGEYARLTVCDTGLGMEETTLDRIFEPFFTTKEVGEGTGLGLSTVHGIVRSHHGYITVDSTPGQGSRFDVYFPAAPQQEISEPSSIDPTQLPTGSERILFVDDEEVVVRLAKTGLGRLGYQITVRTSSIEALEAFRAAPDRFDLIISDQTMPNMTGARLASEVIAIRPDIPIILCTGFSESINEEKAHALGIREFVRKPIVAQELAQRIRDIFDTPPASADNPTH